MDQRGRIGPPSTREFHWEPLSHPIQEKIPMQAGASSIFYTTRLCQRLVQSKSEFDLSDPNGYLLSSEYNSLHDPNLRRYLYRKDIHRRLTAGGFITKHDRVVCSLREMNRYKQHLLDVERDWARKLHMEKKNLLRRVIALNTHAEGLSELTSPTRLVSGSGIQRSPSRSILPSLGGMGSGARRSPRHSALVWAGELDQVQRERRVELVERRDPDPRP